MTYTVDQIIEGFPLTWGVLAELYPSVGGVNESFLGWVLCPQEEYVNTEDRVTELLEKGVYKDPVFYICESLLAEEGWGVEKWERDVITDGTVTLAKGNPCKILLCDGNGWVNWLSEEEHSLLRLCYDSYISRTIYLDAEATGRARLTEIYTNGEGSAADEN